ncbi:hypothetical protein CYY_002119 [Polysphondylium violaceum]|uniref:Mei2-like C-terminal RNA recognition motif domain-containing protein n=1 Tax=Polysphondylium violaceum TaxID=133409 RepID=A0A8J4PYL3_9MYCE|nr:hypothetical protein CYY_002119 [Polysphondylium violaceum]
MDSMSIFSSMEIRLGMGNIGSIPTSRPIGELNENLALTKENNHSSTIPEYVGFTNNRGIDCSNINNTPYSNQMFPCGHGLNINNNNNNNNNYYNSIQQYQMVNNEPHPDDSIYFSDTGAIPLPPSLIANQFIINQPIHQTMLNSHSFTTPISLPPTQPMLLPPSLIDDKFNINHFSHPPSNSQSFTSISPPLNQLLPPNSPNFRPNTTTTNNNNNNNNNSNSLKGNNSKNSKSKSSKGTNGNNNNNNSLKGNNSNNNHSKDANSNNNNLKANSNNNNNVSKGTNSNSSKKSKNSNRTQNSIPVDRNYDDALLSTKSELSDAERLSSSLNTNVLDSGNDSKPLSPKSKATKGPRNTNPISEEEKAKYIVNIELVISGVDQRSCLMIKNLPNKMTHTELLSMVDRNFQERYEFFYLPVGPNFKVNYGYAFINFKNYQDIVPFYNEFFKRKWENTQSVKLCGLTYAKFQEKIGFFEHLYSVYESCAKKEHIPTLFLSDESGSYERKLFEVYTPPKDSNIDTVDVGE